MIAVVPRRRPVLAVVSMAAAAAMATAALVVAVAGYPLVGLVAAAFAVVVGAGASGLARSGVSL